MLPSFVSVRNKPHRIATDVILRGSKRIIMQPEFPTFCQGNYKSTVALALRTGFVCPL